MPDIIVLHGNQRCTHAFTGTPLLHELLRSLGYAVPTPCGGKGVCGKCAVMAQGALDPPPAHGRCLACVTRVLGDAEITLPREEELRNIALAGALPLFDMHPMPGRYGLAVDIGTTTLAAQLIDLAHARVLASASRRNPQREVSDNVIGRIEAALAGQGAQLQQLVKDAIAKLTQEAAMASQIDPNQVDAWVVTGNTTMLYLLTGRDPETLSHAPFEPDWTADETVEGMYLPPCIGAFIGADTVCAILSTRLMHHEGTALLADIGTNGEVALWHGGTLYCCATAAGPAFEGGGIRDGVGSVAGAVDRVWVEDGILRYSTIADETPVGICGSGLVDAAAALLETGQLDETGAMDNDEESIAPGVALTGQDIRKLQLAKGAIAAGIRTLCKTVGIGMEQVDAFYVAGGFGAHLDMDNAAKIGLIPRALVQKAVSVGNAALAGAMMMLLRQEFIEEARNIACKAQVVTLSGSAAFSDAFVDSMMFEEIV
jgi:uncharacterized 2Fe-2S/4Fe-4S cluster protein (DUF4445 family)